MSIWQTKWWQEMLKKSKQTQLYFEIDNVFIEKRSIWLWKYAFFVIGVALTDIQTWVYKKIIELSKQHKVLFVQFETIHYWASIKNSFKKLTSWYYKKFITPYTCVIDLDLSLEDIFSKMKPKWRYNIRLAEKKWIIVKQVEKTDKNIKIFYNLMIETTSRDNFNWNNFDFYKSFLLNIKESKLLICYKDDKAISAGIFTFTDVAIYYYGASTSDKTYRNMMSPYLLQWEAIKIWKEKWCNFYDFLWVSTPWDKKSSLIWVTDFKMKFSNDIRQVSESYLYINNIFIYKTLILFRKIKKIMSF